MALLGLLALTHSSRKTDPERCSADFLRRRFGRPGRLEARPPFEELPPCETLYSGAVSFYRVFDEDGRDENDALRVEPAGAFLDRERIQHLAWADDRHLWLGYEHRLELWRLTDPSATFRQATRLRRRSFEAVRRLEHPHLAGLHTVERLPEGRLAVSCSAPDAVLVLDPKIGDPKIGDPETGALEQTLRMPESLYGRGYELRPERDLRRHYIGDEQQTTHLNAAFPRPGAEAQIAVSALIPGCVGIFDATTGHYREVVRGFTGCHGARFDTAGRLYFTDSPNGALVFLDEDSSRQGGSALQRYQVPSRWLHDARQLHGDLYAFALADSNELQIHDIAAGRLLYRRRFPRWPIEGAFPLARRLPGLGWLGNSVQALAWWPSSGP